MDRALGCMIGVFVGDAAGGTLEFIHDDVTREIAEEACKMVGGGTHGLARGQVTDDGELTICLAMGLLSHLTPAVWYNKWIKTKPFDIGKTCATAFFEEGDCDNYAIVEENMIARAAERNAESKANGALMRVTPMAIKFRNDREELIAYARKDAMLSHPNVVCVDANVAYCLAIAHLIKNPGDDAGAFKVARNWAISERSEIAEWFEDAEKDVFDADVRRQAGYVRWAFTLAFYHLHKKTSFREAIIHTLMRAGDTDTNAAIVGGLMGAYWGVDAMPVQMVGRVVKSLTGVGHMKRPEWLHPRNVYAIVKRLYGEAK